MEQFGRPSEVAEPRAHARRVERRRLISFPSIGEVGLFSPGHRRALTARCVGACTVLSIDESTVKQLYYQNPAFGFKLIALVARRLSADVERLQHQSVERGP